MNTIAEVKADLMLFFEQHANDMTTLLVQVNSQARGTAPKPACNLAVVRTKLPLSTHEGVRELEKELESPEVREFLVSIPLTKYTS